MTTPIPEITGTTVTSHNSQLVIKKIILPITPKIYLCFGGFIFVPGRS